MRMTIPAIFVMAVLSLGLPSNSSYAQVEKTAPSTVNVTIPNFVKLAERLLPTVVNVSTTQSIEKVEQPNMPQFPPGSPFDDFFKEFFEQQKNGHPMPQRRPSALGSGFVVDAEKGYIVTNNHVIKDADEIKIILNGDTSIDAEVIGTDEKTDLALLRIETDKTLIAAKWGDSDNAKVGSWVLAIGNPFGLGGTVTAGIVSARQRDINAGPYDDFIQTDASINKGNSGGPMFNIKGEVIGVNTAIYSPSGGSVGIGFAVPSNLAGPVIQQLIKYGQTKRGWLGVRIQVVTDEIAEAMSLKEAVGALVASVTPDGPAEKAGIKPGDVILTFNKKKIKEMRNLPRIVAETDIGNEVPVEVWRKDKKKTFKVKLGQLEKAEESGLLAEEKHSKDKEPEATKVKGLGLDISPINKALQEQYNLDTDTQGVIITGVDNLSPAADKGLRAGDVILECNQEKVSITRDREQKKVTFVFLCFFYFFEYIFRCGNFFLITF